ARKFFQDKGVACDFLATEPESKTPFAVTRAIEDGAYRCVITMGGDGTFREVASGILDSTKKDHVALGMLPTGTANDQGRSFGLLAGDLERNLEVILAGKETLLDAGKIEIPAENVVQTA